MTFYLNHDIIKTNGGDIMFAISFDLSTSKLKEFYGNNYPQAYTDIKHELSKFKFEWQQGSVYLCSEPNSLEWLFKLMLHLNKIQWFNESLRDIQAFEVHHWSNFTSFVKTGE